MRNRYPGICYRCDKSVAVGEGHFERFRMGWRTQHATCAIEMRGMPDPERQADQIKRLTYWASQTGKKAQRARQTLRAVAEDEGAG
jgi:hypothetical protein